MRRFPLLSILLFIALLLSMPIFFGSLVAVALHKLHLSQDAAIWIMAAILVGGMIDLPVRRIPRSHEVPVDAFALFGLSGFMQRWQSETIIAVNVGGCLIPAALALYELSMLNSDNLWAAGIASFLTIFVCYLIARPVPGVGILVPGFIPPGVAAAAAIFFSPGEAPAVAFIAGVSGVLIGADFFHLREVTRSQIGMASIGGAGSFDAIILAGIIAAYLA
jgi:uncharacterized membrane protein